MLLGDKSLLDAENVANLLHLQVTIVKLLSIPEQTVSVLNIKTQWHGHMIITMLSLCISTQIYITKLFINTY